MKKYFLSPSFILASLFMMCGSQVSAQTVSTLPDAGLTPESMFYFLDTLGESLHRFFTFNPEARARLEITFAAEKIAEMKVIMLDKGIEARGLSVAEERLQDNLSRAAEIVAAEKAKGNDVSALVSALTDEVDRNKESLKGVFEGQKQALEIKEDQLKLALREARRSGDTAKAELLTKELQDLKLQKEALDHKEGEDEHTIDAENEKLEQQTETKAEAAEKIREAWKEKIEIVHEYQKADVSIPAGTFDQFDSLLAQARAAFEAGNYQDARRFVKQAEANLENVDRALDGLKDAAEQHEERRGETDGRQKETEETQAPE